MASCTISATDKYQERYFKNTNDLLDSKSKYYYQYAIGVKTGFTTQAKNCLIAASKKDNLELITVVLGAEATPDGRSGRYVLIYLNMDLIIMALSKLPLQILQ